MKSFETNPAMQRGLWPSIGLAFVLWFVMFVLQPLNFWVMLSFSTTLLSAVAFALGRPLIPKPRIHCEEYSHRSRPGRTSVRRFLLGEPVSPSGIPALSISPSRPCTGHRFCLREPRRALPIPCRLSALFPHRVRRGNLWRGFVQRRFRERGSATTAFVLTTLLYTAIHVPTGNPVLILAALTGGLFWGGFYRATGSLVPVLVSHMLWDPFIFVVFPIR